MSRVTVTKEIEWDMAHRLVNDYPGKCKYLHGHRYKLEITITAETYNAYGMVIDFGDIKTLFKTWIDENLDHGMIVSESDQEMVGFLCSTGQKYYVVDFNTTAEEMVRYFAHKFEVMLRDSESFVARGVSISRLRLFETPTSYAEWNRGQH